MTRPLLKLLLAGVLVLALAGLAGVSMAKATGPEISFEKTEIPFSNIKEGSQQKALFKFKNTGALNLIIDQVSPSCGCTVAEFDEVTEPGKTGVVRLDLDTAGIIGSFRKTAVVATNDPNNPFVTLVMIGETASRIKMDLGQNIEMVGCLGEDLTATATLTATGGGPLLIAGVKSEMKDYLSTRLEKMPSGEAYKLHLKSLSEHPIEFAGPIYLQIPGQPKVSIWVTVNLKGPFTTRPHEIYFGAIDLNGPVPMRRILVEKACSVKLNIDQIKYNQDLLDIKRVWSKEGETLVLEVRPILKNLMPGKIQEFVSIAAQGQMFKVFVRGVIK